MTPETRTARTLTAPNGVTCITSLTSAEALALLKTHTSDFAARLCAILANGGTLTKNQAIYVYILAEEVATTATPAPAVQTVPEVLSAPAPTPDTFCAGIVRTFDAAIANGAKVLRVRILVNGTRLLVKNGATRGFLYVRSAGDDDTYYGKIDAAGRFLANNHANGDVYRALEAFANDPVGTAAAYGHLTGECCFCGRSLYDDSEGSSVEVGYGPVCATKYGLPHAGNCGKGGNSRRKAARAAKEAATV